MPVNRFFSPLSVCFLSAAFVLSGCDPQSPVPNPLSSDLRVDAQPDSVIATPDKIDFSSVSEVGQGPTGSLIRRNLVGAPGGNYYAYTYDQQSRLVGSFYQTSYGYNSLVLVRYQGSYLTEAYTGIQYKPTSDARLGYVARYQYDDNNQLGQVLIYINLDGILKLDATIRYEYNAAEQLQLTRHTYGLSSKAHQGVYPAQLWYWVNGDNYRLETYHPNRTPITSTNRLFYN